MDARAGTLWHKTAGEAIPWSSPRDRGGPVWLGVIYEQSAQDHSGYSNRFGFPASEYSHDYEDQYNYYREHKPGYSYQDYYKPSPRYPPPDSNFIEDTIPQIFKSGALGYRPRQSGPPRCRGLLRGIASPALLCHKEPARASKAPY